MASYYQNRRMPLRPACGLHEDEPVIPQSKQQKEVPSFPLSEFPSAIRNIVEALVEYEHFNVNFISASMFTTFAAAIGIFRKKTIPGKNALNNSGRLSGNTRLK